MNESEENKGRIHWTEELIDDIARRKSVIYLGSGISASSSNGKEENPPTWEKFLSIVLSIKKKELSNNYDLIQSLIDSKDYLMACDIIVNDLGEKEFGNIARKEFLNQYTENDLHKTIYDLDSRFIMTPNVDVIYETYATKESRGGAIVKLYSDIDVAQYLRPGLGEYLIIKAHGTVQTSKSMIFTQSQYNRARNEYSSFYKILDALLLTHTFIFMGCGITDPDIQLALENFNFSFPEARPHYMIIPSDEIPNTVLECLERNRNLRFLKYDNHDGKHTQLLYELKNLYDAVSKLRERLSEGMVW